MYHRRVNVYVGLMCAAAVVCLAFADWHSVLSMPADAKFGLASLLVLALVSESLAIGLTLGGGKGGAFSSIIFLPLLATVQLFGPVAGLSLIVVSMAFAEGVVRRKSAFKATFNVAQMSVATTVAGFAWAAAGGEPLNGIAQPAISSQLGPFVAFGLVFLALNHAAVSMAIALSEGQAFRRVWDQAWRISGASLQDILISPIALAVAFLYTSFGPGGIFVALLPLLFIRYSYLTMSQLRESNADLLKALVKAIEVRDPYTSGHSQRVSYLAKQIAEELGLKPLTVQHIKNAALLHDIGKIEAVYTEILRKPDQLTPEERAIIESHVTNGEKLLRALSSVPEEVVLAVRHHHEREDGLGYPDGLLGHEIPIGAKIIVVCDAVDAMLSDRPYRRALALPVVLEQLQIHAGKQFDHQVVRALTRSDILAEFAELIKLSREAEELSREAGPNLGVRLPPSLATRPTARPRDYAH